MHQPLQLIQSVSCPLLTQAFLAALLSSPRGARSRLGASEARKATLEKQMLKTRSEILCLVVLDGFGSSKDRFEFNDRLWNQFLRIAQPYFLPYTASWLKLFGATAGHDMLPAEEEEESPGFLALIAALLVGAWQEGMLGRNEFPFLWTLLTRQMLGLKVLYVKLTN